MKSKLLQDYLRTQKLPDVDSLLDWRNRLIVMRTDNKDYPDYWYENEIKACDLLLAKHSL